MNTDERSPATAFGNERGIALVLSLILLTAMSVLATSMMFLSQTETYATMNYRLMSQARYAAESGVQKTANWLLNSYTLPGGGGDPLSNYNMTTSPVQYVNQPVVLSTLSGVSSNYPAAATVTAFAGAATGSLAAGLTTATYTASATLMSMQQALDGTIVQRWQITADGTIGGARSATVEVTASLENQIKPISGHGYAAFSTGDGCGAITFTGSAATDIYDSAHITMSGGHPLTATSLGGFTADVGTNGNLKDSGGATINGKLYTPRTGVGTCNNGAGGIAGDAITQSGSATVTGGLVQLPAVVTIAPPAAPNPLPPTTNQNFAHNTGCGAIASCSYPSGAGTPNVLKFAGGNSPATATQLGNVSTTSDVVVHLGAASGCPCYYALNSLSVTGGSSIVIDGGPVILNIEGASQATPINLSGGGVANATFIPSNLQILYAGAGNVTLTGGTSTAAVLDAPNAAVTLAGGADFYGSITSNTLTDSGGTKIHYDKQLNSLSSSSTAGSNWALSSFSWKKY